MIPDLRYIELKSGYSDDGPAWIGIVEFSKSGQTVYFNNKALKKLKTRDFSGNHFDLENGEVYWISGVKLNGQNRHWAGRGKVMIQKEAVGEYLSRVGQDKLDESRFEIVKIEPTDKGRLIDIENEVGNIQ